MPDSAPHRCKYCGTLTRELCACERPWAQHTSNWSRLTREEMNAWRRFSRAWLKAYPWCIDCGQPARVVCHVRGADYAWDRCNPASIEGQRCHPCDARETGSYGLASRV